MINSFILFPYGLSCKSNRSKRILWVCVVAASFVPLTIVAEHWPLRIAFRVSERQLNDMAAKCKSNSHIELPYNAGFFAIEKCIINDSRTCVALLLDDDPAGRTGFVKYDLPFRGSKHILRNLNYNIKVSDGWYYQNED